MQEMLKRYHTNVYPPCRVAMHIGCAWWKLDCTESIWSNQLFYFPATLSDDNNSYKDEENDGILNLGAYFNVHAKVSVGGKACNKINKVEEKSKHPMWNGERNCQLTNKHPAEDSQLSLHTHSSDGIIAQHQNALNEAVRAILKNNENPQKQFCWRSGQVIMK